MSNLQPQEYLRLNIVIGSTAVREQPALSEQSDDVRKCSTRVSVYDITDLSKQYWLILLIPVPGKKHVADQLLEVLLIESTQGS